MHCPDLYRPRFALLLPIALPIKEHMIKVRTTQKWPPIFDRFRSSSVSQQDLVPELKPAQTNAPMPDDIEIATIDEKNFQFNYLWMLGMAVFLYFSLNPPIIQRSSLVRMRLNWDRE